jgi:hypothetical protein
MFIWGNIKISKIKKFHQSYKDVWVKNVNYYFFSLRKCIVLVSEGIWYSNMGTCWIYALLPYSTGCCLSHSVLTGCLFRWESCHSKKIKLLSEIHLKPKSFGYLSNWYKKVPYETLCFIIYKGYLQSHF